MLIYIGADHRGFDLKEQLKSSIHGDGYELIDVGNSILDKNDDYPDFAKAVAKEVGADPDNRRGILICGSGAGVDITANKFKGVRSALAISSDQIYSARHDDDVNVLSLAANFISVDDVRQIVRVFLATPFSGEEKHKRRIDKISELEKK